MERQDNKRSRDVAKGELRDEPRGDVVVFLVRRWFAGGRVEEEGTKVATAVYIMLARR